MIIGLLVIAALIAIFSIAVALFAYATIKLDETITAFVRNKK